MTESIFNPTNRHRQEDIIRLKTIIYESKHVILADADMTDELTLCYNKLLPQGRKFTKIDCLYKNLQGRKAKFNTNSRMFFNNITEGLRNKNKLIIPSQSKEQLKDIFIKLQELNKLEILNLKLLS